MSPDIKNLSNPYSSGGGGYVFENQIQTSFVVLMLSDGFLPCLPGKRISKIKIQCRREGFFTDDLVAYTEDIISNIEYKFLAQVKHEISVSNSDKKFQNVINAAWRDFNNPITFSKNKDVLALITGPLSRTDIYDTRVILDWARHSESAEDYFDKKIKLGKFSSDSKRKKVEVFRNALKKANNNNDISDSVILSFLKHFYILGYDLDLKSGVLHSLFTSIINHFQIEIQANLVWSRIYEEVNFSNQSAGTITKETLPSDIRDFFKVKKMRAIPDDYVKPTLEELKNTRKQIISNMKSIFIAILLGGWNENSNGDNELISEFVTEYRDWFNDIREIHKESDELFSLRNGHWKVKDKFHYLKGYTSYFYDYHLDLIQKTALEVLSKINPAFDLKPEDRFAAEIYGKKPNYSDELRKGIVETLIFLGIYGKELENCTFGKAETIPILVIRELFKEGNWKLWASLNDLLPLLAEAAPQEFLASVENALSEAPCPFDELFTQEGKGGIFGANYMTGLYWALESLAWNEDYLSIVILLLAELDSHDPGGNWGNRPLSSLITILLPWIPQTTASINNRIASLKGIQRHFPDIALKVLVKLLPNSHQISSGSYKPKFRNYIPKDWNERATPQEYWEQIELYSAMAVDMAKNNISYVINLVDNLDNIPQQALKDFLKYLSSGEVINLADKKKQLIWEKMISLVNKHRQFPDANGAIPIEIVNNLENIAAKLKPQDPLFSNKHLFSNRISNFFDKDEDWKTQQKIILEKRINALETIYEINGLESILAFTKIVEKAEIVGNTFACIASFKDDQILLPSFLNTLNDVEISFIQDYIWGRFYKIGISWFENLKIETWAKDQKITLLINLPFEKEIWEKVDDFLGESASDYWRKIKMNPMRTISNLEIAAEKMINYKRYYFALECIYAHSIKKNIFLSELALKAFTQGISNNESFEEGDPYHLIKIIKMLQDDPKIDDKHLIKIEWYFLPLLDRYDNATPKTLEKYLSQDPEFFVEVIKIIYRSKKGDKSKKDMDEIAQRKAQNGWKLLHDWKRPPGKNDDGSFSEDLLKKWVEKVKTKTIESGHFEIAMINLGHVLYYSDPDPNGLWIHQSVAEILDDKKNQYIRQGFTTEIYNSRGAHFVDPSGSPEKEIAKYWRKRANIVEKLGYIYLATSLKDIAKSYDRDAERIIADHSNVMEKIIDAKTNKE